MGRESKRIKQEQALYAACFAAREKLVAAGCPKCKGVLGILDLFTLECKKCGQINVLDFVPDAAKR